MLQVVTRHLRAPQLRAPTTAGRVPVRRAQHPHLQPAQAAGRGAQEEALRVLPGAGSPLSAVAGWALGLGNTRDKPVLWQGLRPLSLLARPIWPIQVGLRGYYACRQLTLHGFDATNIRCAMEELRHTWQGARALATAPIRRYPRPRRPAAAAAGRATATSRRRRCCRPRPNSELVL